MKYWQVDSFTTTPFTGNPAGVCVLQEALPVATMQKIASEVNLSETAFVERVGRVRHFTGVLCIGESARFFRKPQPSLHTRHWYLPLERRPLSVHHEVAASGARM